MSRESRWVSVHENKSYFAICSLKSGIRSLFVKPPTFKHAHCNVVDELSLMPPPLS